MDTTRKPPVNNNNPNKSTYSGNKESAITKGLDMVRNAKTRGNYVSGGWCSKRSECANDDINCGNCFKYSEFKLKGDNNEKPKEPNHTTASISGK